MPWDHKQSAKEVIRHVGLKLGAGDLLRRRRRRRGLVTAHLDSVTAADRFRDVYRSGAWISSEGQQSYSGLGSEASATGNVAEVYPCSSPDLDANAYSMLVAGTGIGCGMSACRANTSVSTSCPR